MMAIDAARYEAAELTYPEHGASSGQLPAGYRHVIRRERIGEGEAAYRRAVESLFSWRVHRGAGLSVLLGPAPAVGAVAVTRLGPPIVGPVAPCRIIAVVDEPRRRGFAYGTLPGHPFAGEESFVVEWAGDGSVWFSIRAFSRPATLLVRLGAPVVRLVQTVITVRFVRAQRRATASA